MQAIAARRRPGPVLVYVSASARKLLSPDWPPTVRKIGAALPAEVILDTFVEAFPGGRTQYRHRWQGYAEDLDGLIVFGTRTAENTYLLGPGARQELRTVARAGLPVLLHAHVHGLVPVVDCRPERNVPEPRELPCLELTVPAQWSAEAPTLRAALQALTPASPPEHQDPWPSLNTRAENARR
jgi:hypothetical protein